ncbi:hypothetical protein EVAR_11244_1 [Eumeta japonica]|uniref:Uncharacterized protein n=1 Tax=Eumeta variegata TaxID=151549 RepID=A0A4C1UKN2_EUMVA|nr:hypothetical protein EVAR_11244_1 [Eumeta japonica]
MCELIVKDERSKNNAHHGSEGMGYFRSDAGGLVRSYPRSNCERASVGAAPRLGRAALKATYLRSTRPRSGPPPLSLARQLARGARGDRSSPRERDAFISQFPVPVKRLFIFFSTLSLDIRSHRAVENHPPAAATGSSPRADAGKTM